MPNVNSLSIKEAFNNDNGKTSGNKLIGIVTTFVCLFILVACTIYYFVVPEQGETILELLDKILYFYITGCGTMGVKTISAYIGGNHINTAGKQLKNKKKPKPKEKENETTEE